ncbi:glucosylceramidase [Ranunculus cassubicifolius]
MSSYDLKKSWPIVTSHTPLMLDFDSAAPPEQAWRRRLNSHANILKEFSVTFMEALKMMRLGVRLWSYVREEASKGRKAPIDPFTRESCKPSASQGVPLGGMGSGSISRGFRGEFRKLQIIPGLNEPSPILANQFSIFISRDHGNKKFASVLAPGVHEDSGKSDSQGISSWGWNLSGQHSTYHALFPMAWTIYDGEPDPELKISCRQISPFIPHNYRESSLPVSVFVYTVCDFHCSSIFSSDKTSAGSTWTATDHPPVTFAIAACETQNVNVTVLLCFGLSEKSHITAKDMWGTMAQNGHFDRGNFSTGPSIASSPGDTPCAAVSASTWVEAHGKCTIAFSLAWSSPKIKFSKGSTYNRRYTKFYGTSERAALNLAHDALTNYKKWEEEIEKWQNPILNDASLPEWYKFTLFNELYFLVAGGTIWIDFVLWNEQHGLVVEHEKVNGVPINGVYDMIDDDDEKMYKSLCDSESMDREDNSECSLVHISNIPAPLSDDEDVGRFLYLEGVEYIMWCTYDVHFYASFALLVLFPKIELSIQRDFAKAVLSEDLRKVKFLAEGNVGVRKVRGAVPHDLGTHDPWHEMNAYNIHDTSKWKDLNPKFVLQVYRDFAATGDMTFAADMWPAVCAAMEYMEQFDRDGDGLIENDGFPDQTYDAWTVHGISAYCGCLWLAALEAAAAMADQLGDTAFADKYKRRFLTAKAVFEAKLWNGSYFNYDSGSSSNSRSIQADQLAGQWYIASSGLPPLFEESKIRSSLQKIYDFNVMKVKGGRLGAVNGMHPNGKVDESCMQSREIWTGVTYGVAATMILTDMKEEAFTTAEGIFTAGWSEEGYGYWFQTPEGWTVDGHYRSLIYMRPLAIWAMQWSLSLPKSILNAPTINMMDRMSTPNNPKASSNHVSGVKKFVKKTKCFTKPVFRCAC